MQKKESAIISYIIGWMAFLIYFTGMAFLVPLLAIIIFPPDIFILPPNLNKLTIFALFLVVASTIMLVKQKKSTGAALQYIAIMNFTIGIVAVVFVLIGKSNILSATHIFGHLKPAAEGYIEYWAYFLPRLWISITIYFILGIIAWMMGNSLKRKEHTLGIVHKVFGERAKIRK